MIEEHIGTAALAGLLIAFNRGGGMVEEQYSPSYITDSEHIPYLYACSWRR